jgi:hypothetical protein
MGEAENRGAMAPRDRIYRDSAMALSTKRGREFAEWMDTPLEIRCLPETAERS